MYQANILHKQGYKKGHIAEILGVNRRSVYNYLNSKVFQPGSGNRGRPHGSRKLSPFFDFIEQQLEIDLYLSGEALFHKLVGMGYTGKTTILNDHLKRRREELAARAVLRFETIPGLHAQVDWADAGRVWVNGKRVKWYCFVMKLGFCRRSYMEFTTSMKQPILFACMKRAFAYFGGVPAEILFDNMKTAFLYSAEEGRWEAHTKMSAFAVHYGFIPRRCRVRRPQTKGKVEREIRYLRSSFFPWLRLDCFDISTLSTDELNEHLMEWLKRVDGKLLRDFNQSRLGLFEIESEKLLPLPATAFKHRETIPVKVSMDAKVTFRTNRYSINAEYRGKTLEARHDPDAGILTIYAQGTAIKEFPLSSPGSRCVVIDPKNHKTLVAAWHADNERHEQRMRRIVEKKKRKAQEQVATTHPTVFDRAFGIVDCHREEVVA